jgi:rubrerythrin
MSGRGETPNGDGAEVDSIEVGPGQTLYTDDGDPVGEVRGIEEAGLFVSVREGVEALSIEHARSGQSFGKAELMWRCMQCGEMGTIDGELPPQCPSCGADREQVMYWTED